MQEFLENLRKEAEQNPTMTLAVAAGLITAISKLVTAHGQAVGSRAFARDVNRRVRASKK